MHILLVLALAGFCSALSVRILDPMVPDIARDFAADPLIVAQLATAFALPYAIGQPILGPLGDALGKARVIKGCLIVLTLALIGCALAPTLDTLFAARILAGLASGGVIPLSFAIIGDRFAMAERQVALSRVLAAILTGGLGGGLLAGIVGDMLGWRAVLWIIAGATAATVLATLSSLEPQSNVERPPLSLGSARNGYRQVFANPRAYVCFAAVFVEGIVVFGIMPFLAIIFEERGIGSIREAGFAIAAFGFGGVLFTIMVRAMLQRLGLLWLIRIGGLLCAAALAVVALGADWPEKVAAYVAVGFGFYMVHNSLQTQATELAPEARGAAVALHAFFFFLGHAAGPIVFGMLKQSSGTTNALIVCAAAMALTGFATAAGIKATRKRS
jgi:predicted MFS family arabinose efflux permease